jgi:hypothetical protein
MYGIDTLLQVLERCHFTPVAGRVKSSLPRGVPPLRISDYPLLKHRGYLFDMSKNRVSSLTFSLLTSMDFYIYPLDDHVFFLFQKAALL